MVCVTRRWATLKRWASSTTRQPTIVSSSVPPLVSHTVKDTTLWRVYDYSHSSKETKAWLAPGLHSVFWAAMGSLLYADICMERRRAQPPLCTSETSLNDTPYTSQTYPWISIHWMDAYTLPILAILGSTGLVCLVQSGRVKSRSLGRVEWSGSGTVWVQAQSFVRRSGRRMSVGEGSVMEWIERRPQRMLQSGDGDVKVLATGPQGMHRLQGTAELQRVNGLRIRTKDGVKEFSVDPRGIASTAVKE